MRKARYPDCKGRRADLHEMHCLWCEKFRQGEVLEKYLYSALNIKYTFKLFQNKKYFRLLLFLILGLITISVIAYSNDMFVGFPAVYLHLDSVNYRYNPIYIVCFSFIKMMLNLLVMCSIFFIVENLRARIKSEDRVKILIFILPQMILGGVANFSHVGLNILNLEEEGLSFRIGLLIYSVLLFFIIYGIQLWILKINKKSLTKPSS